MENPCICNKAGTEKCPNVKCRCAAPHVYDLVLCDGIYCSSEGHVYGHVCIPITNASWSAVEIDKLDTEGVFDDELIDEKMECENTDKRSKNKGSYLLTSDGKNNVAKTTAFFNKTFSPGGLNS